LFTEEALCVTRAANNIGKLTLKKFLASEHISIAFNQDIYSDITDKELTVHGLQRNIVIAVPHILAALLIAANTSLLALVPARVAIAMQHQLKLTLHKPPIALPTVTLSLAWHKRYEKDAGHVWLRELIQQTIENI
jgi:DNA-binding transcriptional LysR family regulator